MGERSSLEGARDDMVGKFIQIPGLGRSRAEAIYDAGYTNLGLLKKASVEELTRIPGVGISLARCIKNNISIVKEELPAEVSVTGTGATSAAATKEETGKVVVGTAPAATASPAGTATGGAGAGAASGGTPPVQSRGFLTSLFGKILGKPEEKRPGTKPAEKIEEVKVEGKPEDKSVEVKVEGKPESKPEDAAKAGAISEASKEGARAEGKPAEEGVKVEGKG